MKLSIIIVNYNVKYFLEQALASVRKASKSISIEVIVVDNASADGSAAFVKKRFPEVVLIENNKNVGFAKANNQAIKISKGEFVLLLNPDTLLQEDTLEKTLQFMDTHSEAGALGVKMLDGKGNFLPESKRSLPTPAVSFFKITGLSSIFPKSKIFGKYHLGFLDENETHEVDVLSGAFMLIRKKVLDEIGLLDETFFMYGEDIDLSYRIQKAGYKNFYLAHTRIIHYKGESTKKGSLNYVRMFYRAMNIFAEKHFSSGQAKVYSFIISIAVYLSAVATFLKNALKKIALPAVDAALLFAGMVAIKKLWATNIKNAPEYYPPEFSYFIIPAYILFWIVAVFLSGGYDKPAKNYRVVRGLLVGTLFIAAFYAFLPETLRFSRAMILLGAMWAVFAMVGLRLLVKILSDKSFDLSDESNHRIVIVGSNDEAGRALSLLSHSPVDYKYVGFVTPQLIEQTHQHHLGTLDELPDIREMYAIDEILFCSKDVSAQATIAAMVENGPELNYKIVPENSASVIGSNSKNTAGDLYAIDINLSIAQPMNRRNKRIFDFISALLLLLVCPVFMVFQPHPWVFLKNVLSVFIGMKTWVGYANAFSSSYTLPSLKIGVLSPVDVLKNKNISDSAKARLNLFYAKDYSVYDDVNILMKGWRILS